MIVQKFLAKLTFILLVPKKTNDTKLDYTKKEDYGKVPAYMTQVKEEIRRENEMIERYVKHAMGEVDAPEVEYEEMTEAERLELLQQLKDKWDVLNAQYQRSSHLVRLDTTGQVRRKEDLERELAKIEKDIDNLERARNILIHK